MGKAIEDFFLCSVRKTVAGSKDFIDTYKHRKSKKLRRFESSTEDSMSRITGRSTKFMILQDHGHERKSKSTAVNNFN